MFKLLRRKIALPITLNQFDALVDKVCIKYELTDKRHAGAIMSVAIRHLPNDQAHTTLKYLGDSVLRNLAGFVAGHKSDEYRHESQVDQLEALLTKEPLNAQARDELVKAANDGSQRAKDALERLGGLDECPKILTLHPTSKDSKLLGTIDLKDPASKTSSVAETKDSSRPGMTTVSNDTL